MESDWSRLPIELLEIISDRLTTFVDHVRFRAVCRNWANTPPPGRSPRQMPWMLLPYKLNTETRTFLSISENQFYHFKSPEFRGRNIFGSYYGWIALVGETSDILLYEPLTGEKILLPKLTELPEAHRFRESQEDDPNPIWDVQFMRHFKLNCLVLSGDPSSPDQDCWVAMCYSRSSNTLAFCRLGVDSWTQLENEAFDDFDDQDCADIIFYNGLLYAIDSSRRIVCYDLKSPCRLTEVHPEVHYDTRHMCLTVMGGSLVLIRASLGGAEEEDNNRQRRRINYLIRLRSIDVFKFDEIRNELVELHNLGDYVVFVDANCCMSMLASEIPGDRPNCIYFAENFEVEKGVYASKGYTLSSFDVGNSSIQRMVSFVLRGYDSGQDSMQDVWYTPNFISNWKTSQSSRSATTESPLWIPNGKGIFSIKVSPSLDLYGRCCFPGPIEPKKWDTIDHRNLPATLQLVLWRVACGVVPLHPVGIFPKFLCPLCHQEEESLEHLLLFCQFTRIAWLNSPWPIRHSKEIDLSGWVNSILDACPSLGLGRPEAEEFLLFVAIFILEIWMVRNHAAAGRAIPHPMDFASLLRKIHRDRLAWHHERAKAVLGHRWTSPDAGETKVNFAVAICRDFAMLSMTCRDQEGRFLIAQTEKIPTCEAMVAEAKAAFFAIFIAIKAGFTKLQVEGTDPFVLKPLMHTGLSPYHGISGIIGDIKTLLKSLEVWWVNCVRVRENIAAHNLACWAAFYGRTGSVPVPSLPACVMYADDIYFHRVEEIKKEAVVEKIT